MSNPNEYINPGYLHSDYGGTSYRVGNTDMFGPASYPKDGWDVTVTFKKKIKAVAGHYLPRDTPLDDPDHTTIRFWAKQEIEDYYAPDGNSVENFYSDYRELYVKEKQ